MHLFYRLMSGIVTLLLLWAAAPRTAHAQRPVEIKLHCQVSGYSGWVRIDPGCKSGGKVIREKGGGLVTDRVMRKEKLRVSIDDPSFTRKCKCEFLATVSVRADNGGVFKGEITIPFQQEYVVSRDPQFDNVIITVFDPIAPGGKVSRRIPIGTR